MNNLSSPDGYQDSNESQFESDSVDFKRYISLFVSNWYWFTISIFIALSIAYGINRYSEELFTVSSTILIKDDQMGSNTSLAENIVPGSRTFNSKQNLNNEIGILKSFKLNKRVIDSLPEFRVVYFGVGRRNIVESRLYKRCPFRVSTSSLNIQPAYVIIYIRIDSDSSYTLSINGNLKFEESMKFGQRFNKYDFDFVIEPRYSTKLDFDPEASNKYYFYFSSSESLANNYRSKLGVVPINNEASLVTLSTTGSVVEQEVDYLNKLMDLYIQLGLESKNKIADNTIKFIDEQLKVTSDSLTRAENELQDFRYKNKLVDISNEGNLTQVKLEQFEKEKSQMDLQIRYYEYLEEYLKTRNESEDIVSPYIMGIADPTLVRLVQNLADHQKNKMELSMNLKGNLPAIRLLEDNIITARNSLLENVNSGIINIKNSISEINNKIKEVNSEIDKLPVKEREMINIQRQFDINNTVYTYLLEKRAETAIAKASNVPDNEIIDRAEIFNAYQIRPKKRDNYLKALLLGLLIPAIIINLLYYFNNRIIDNTDIKKRTNVPIVGYVSHNSEKKEVPVYENPGSSLAESFRAIRTSLKYYIKDNYHPVIAITSTISSEGKTFVSVNLAAITALLGKKVLLIGLDLRKPRIHRILDIDNSVGMSSYLSFNCEYEDVIKETAVKNLYYATSGPVPPNPAELIDDERMKTFIDKAKEEFDFIIIDTPPVAIVTDTLMLSKLVDINLFIVRQRYSSKNTIDLIQELFRSEKLANMGIIMNDISLTGYYGYGLRYGYYKGYGYSFGKNYYGQYSYGKYGYSEKEQGYYKS